MAVSWPPTRGRRAFTGAPLLLIKLGAGFHPDLAGRENICLKGSILRISRKETGDRIDEIVSFAELPGFIDTPIKRYSSTVYMRLAFAVAARSEPDILLVDCGYGLDAVYAIPTDDALPDRPCPRLAHSGQC